MLKEITISTKIAVIIVAVARKLAQELGEICMTSDFSWRNSALGYQQLYERAIARMGEEI